MSNHKTKTKNVILDCLNLNVEMTKANINNLYIYKQFKNHL